METLTSTVAAPFIHTRASARGSRLFRAGVCAAGLLLSGPALAASPAQTDHRALSNSARMDPSPGDPSPGSRAATRGADPSLPREPNPTGVTTPDPASGQEISKGEYGVGLGLLILGGVILTGMVVGLFMVMMRRTWGEHDDAPAPSRH
jgi:hypothetical protein